MTQFKSRKAEIAWESTLWSNEGFVRETLKSMTERASRGDPHAIANLAKTLKLRPDLIAVVRELGFDPAQVSRGTKATPSNARSRGS